MGSKGEWNFVKEASLPSRVLYEKKTARAFKNNLQEKEEKIRQTDLLVHIAYFSCYLCILQCSIFGRLISTQLNNS